MKTTLIAAAFLIPTLVFGADPQSKDSYGQKEKSSQQQIQGTTQTPTQVLTDIHQLSQQGIERANVAQSNASNDKLKTFAEKQVKDFQKLDKAVLDLAKERKITLTSGASTGSKDYGTTDTQRGSGSDTMGGSVESSDQMGTGTTGSGSSDQMGSSGTPGSTTGSTTQTGTANDTRTGTATDTTGSTGSTGSDITGTTPDTRMGSTTGKMGSELESDTRWQRVRSLSGSEFDTEYLSLVSENAVQHLSHLQSARIQGDRKINKVIDTAVKTFKDHQRQVERLQRDITPAS